MQTVPMQTVLQFWFDEHDREDWFRGGEETIANLPIEFLAASEPIVTVVLVEPELQHCLHGDRLHGCWW